MKLLRWIVFILVVIGAINWGLVGIWDFNAISRLDGVLSAGGILARVLYIVVGVCGVLILCSHCKCKKNCKS